MGVHGLNRVVARKAVAQARRVGEQVLDRHGRLGLDRDVALFDPGRGRDSACLDGVVVDFEVRPALDVLGHRVVELKPAFLVEHHERDARHGLGHRVEAHDRVPLVRALAIHVAEPADVEERFFAAPGNQAHRAGELAFLDVPVDVASDARQPISRKPVTHRLSLNRLRSSPIPAGLWRVCVIRDTVLRALLPT